MKRKDEVMHQLFLIVPFFALILSPGYVIAEGEDIFHAKGLITENELQTLKDQQGTSAQEQEQEQAIEELKAWKTQVSKLPTFDRSTPVNLPKLSFGLNSLQIRYRDSQRDTPEGVGTNDFNIQRAEFTLRGSLGDFGPIQVKKWHILANFTSQGLRRPTSPTGEKADPTNTQLMREAFIDLAPTGSLKGMAPYVHTVRIGQWRIPFGISADTSAGLLDFIELPYLAGVGSGADAVEFIQERDQYLQFIGTPVRFGPDNYLEYNALIMNGNSVNGKFGGSFDNNSQKDFIGRIRYHPFKGFWVSASTMFGHSTAINNNVFGRGDGKYDRMGLDFRWTPGTDMKTSSSPIADHNGLWLQGEYITGHDAPGAVSRGATDVTGFASTAGAQRTTGYLYAKYKFENQWEPTVRYEWLDPNNVANNTYTRLTLGVNYYLINQPGGIQSKIMMNYEIRNRDGLSGRDAAMDTYNNDQAQMMLQLRWY
tara:strand:- start:1214 stop:2656 length:1443 start_codon:yes stop_codon:yes gene_type:complete